MIIAVAGIVYYILPSLPNTSILKEIKMQIPLHVYTTNGTLISRFGEKRRTPIKIEQVPKRVIQAFLVSEDDRFFSHPGVDWQGIMRATYKLLTTGNKSQGGSTITMQVARNFFLTNKKSYKRKFREIFLALKMERELSKEEILELYLNKIYFGHRIYGIVAAAEIYYGKTIDKLNLAQISMIAGIPQRPSKHNPITNPEKATQRRNYVLKRLLEKKIISKEDYEINKKATVSASLHLPNPKIKAPYVAEMVRRYMLDKFGADAYTKGFIVTTTIQDHLQTAANQAVQNGLLNYDSRHNYRGPETRITSAELNNNPKTLAEIISGIPVIGDLAPALIVQLNNQSATVFIDKVGLVEIPWQGLAWAKRNPQTPTSKVFQIGDIVRLRKTENNQWRLTQIPKVQGSLVSLNPNNGALLALVGGFDFRKSKFNRATQAFRQPGSGFKPFIYSAALAEGKTAATIINDVPFVANNTGLQEQWRPMNYSRKNYGPTRLRDGLVYSRNIVSIRILEEIGLSNARHHIEKFGFNINQQPNNLSLALGTGETSPWQLAQAYSIFANGGYFVEPYYVQSIMTYDGETIYEVNPKTICRECGNSINSSTRETSPPSTSDSTVDIQHLAEDYAPQVIDSRVIYIINSVTRDVIKRGTGRKALSLNRTDIAGKTGTTNDQRDAWFSGFNANVVTVVWAGFDNFAPLGQRETGARVALPIWIDYMRAALKDQPIALTPRPKGLTNIRIDAATGLATHADNEQALFEIFRNEYAPQPQQIEANYADNVEQAPPEQLF